MSNPSTHKRVLILCTGNSCRSQMAEAVWRAESKGSWRADSAGSNPSGYVHPRAVEVMAEIGLDISGNESKSIDRFLGDSIDLVITVCDSARESCPVFPGAKQTLHWPFEDPAGFVGDAEATRTKFREIRDLIRERIEGYLGATAAP